MHVTLEDWQNGWFGLRLAIHPDEIERLIQKLHLIRDDREQHFHLTSDYRAPGGIGDIEISVMTEELPHNLFLSGRALGPGEEVKISGE